MGFDQPRNLGNRETGGGLALPIWINYMQNALKGVPMAGLTIPDGIITVNGEYYYAESPPELGVRSLGIGDSTGTSPTRDEVKNELF